MTQDAGKQRKSTLPDWAKPGRGPVEVAQEKAAGDLRLPRNLLWFAAGAGAVVLLAAFGVGWQMGKKSGLAESEARSRKEIARITRNMTQTGTAGAAQATVPPAPVPAPAATGDPREVGLNYWLLCRAPVAEARKYADFLATEGRRTLLVPVVRAAAAKSGATEMAKLYVIDRGYHYKADRTEIVKSQTELLALGDKWAKRNKGGNPFRSMMLEQYKR